MKLWKKVAAIAMAATLVMGTGITAYADNSNTYVDTEKNVTYTDTDTVIVKAKYKLTNSGTISPATTFTLAVNTEKPAIEKTGALSTNETVPALGQITPAENVVATSEGATGNITIALPNYTHVGIYEYYLKPVTGNYAGVTYFGDDIKDEIRLVVTVINGSNGNLRVGGVHTESSGKKTDTFDNEYSAGSLAVTKTVTGALGDHDKKFNVTVTFTKPAGKEIGDNSITYVDGNETKSINKNDWNNNGVATVDIQLKDKDTITFKNIPYGVTYTVVEDSYESIGYDPATYAFSDAANKLIDSDKDTVEITNNKGGNIDTGVNLDSLPYILILAGVVLVAGFAFFNKRRYTRR